MTVPQLKQRTLSSVPGRGAGVGTGNSRDTEHCEQVVGIWGTSGLDGIVALMSSMVCVQRVMQDVLSKSGTTRSRTRWSMRGKTSSSMRETSPSTATGGQTRHAFAAREADGSLFLSFLYECMFAVSLQSFLYDTLKSTGDVPPAQFCSCALVKRSSDVYIITRNCEVRRSLAVRQAQIPLNI